MKIVIFDMDGTILDSSIDMTSTINFIRKTRYNLEPVSVDMVIESINLPERNLAKMFYGVEKFAQEDTDLFSSHYDNECIKNSYLYDGIESLMRELKGEGVKLSVATNASTKFAKRMLSHLGIAHYFDTIIGADEVELPKPNPQMIDRILQNYSYNSKEDSAWMVGDSLKDIDGAKNAGIDSIFALWGFSSTSSHKSLAYKPNDILKVVI